MVEEADFSQTMDGHKWASAFRDKAKELYGIDLDEGWLIGWFCNAIMAGYDKRGLKVHEPCKKAIEVAARVWCDQEMTSVVMDTNAAMEIARIVDNVLLDQNVPQGE